MTEMNHCPAHQNFFNKLPPPTLEVMKIKEYTRNTVIMYLRIFKYISHAVLLH
jgi:hypothetical protein